MKKYEIISEVKGTEKFLVIKGINESEINRYHLKMAELNSIYGILPIKSQNIDNDVVLNYPLGNHFQLLWLINQNSIGSAEMKTIYTRLVDTIMGMKEYFLEASNCIYDLEHVYIDSRLNPYLVYVPMAENSDEDINRTWKEFFLNLLSYASAGKQDPFYDKLMRLLILPNFNLNTFYNYLKEDVSIDVQPAFRNLEQNTYQQSNAYSTPVDTTPQYDTGASATIDNTPKKGLFGGFGKGNMEVKPASEVKLAPESKAPSAGFAIPGMGDKKGGIAIPGGASATSEQEKKPEKKSLFGFGKKKEEDDEQPKAASVLGEKTVAESKAKSFFGSKQNTDAKPNSGVYTPPAQEVKGEHGVSQGNEGSWKKTVMINAPVVEEERKTVMLGNTQPHLMHGEVYVPINQFPFTLGRASTSYIINNPTVSRNHATIFKQGDKMYIQHVATSNNTYVNGRILGLNEVVELTEGAELILSNETLVYHG